MVAITDGEPLAPRGARAVAAAGHWGDVRVCRDVDHLVVDARDVSEANLRGRRWE